MGVCPKQLPFPILPAMAFTHAFLYIRSRGESSAELRPLSERLLKPPPQLICLALRELPEVLFKLSFQLVQRAFDLKLVHGNLDI
jgi:hypothetical protein